MRIAANLLRIVFFSFLLQAASASGQQGVDLSALSEHQRALLNEHVYGGLPDSSHIYIRNAYVSSYNPEYRVPAWVAYRVVPDYLKTPPRSGKFSRFREAPDLMYPVIDNDYRGLLDSLGYARGHMVPYGVSGGDRNQDGLYADEDDHDQLSIFEVNYLSNIAPQNHSEFNGFGGLWYNLERFIQDSLVRGRGMELWIFAGCLFGPGEVEKVGRQKDIGVPAMFYKIVIHESDGVPRVLAFLFPHQRTAHGEIQNFLVSIDVIEQLTGLDFFHEWEDGFEREFERQDTWRFWGSL
ncbi:MAG TPA: DNA/RNA non-specific endonuclease [bacterium]|nr:DNA/RNA non-specific endonuclease [bacterium]